MWVLGTKLVCTHTHTHTRTNITHIHITQTHHATHTCTHIPHHNTHINTYHTYIYITPHTYIHTHHTYIYYSTRTQTHIPQFTHTTPHHTHREIQIHRQTHHTHNEKGTKKKRLTGKTASKMPKLTWQLYRFGVSRIDPGLSLLRSPCLSLPFKCFNFGQNLHHCSILISH